ncbi:hypothetical protein WMY93_021435 [Mugilogobius chulae]|uniref:Uncharacterized protein n=1 Tax=Mugilogobius chulae TaxID=88201 RepID=A0AAW0NDX7_9GOBI
MKAHGPGARDGKAASFKHGKERTRSARRGPDKAHGDRTERAGGPDPDPDPEHEGMRSLETRPDRTRSARGGTDPEHAGISLETRPDRTRSAWGKRKSPGDGHNHGENSCNRRRHLDNFCSLAVEYCGGGILSASNFLYEHSDVSGLVFSIQRRFGSLGVSSAILRNETKPGNISLCLLNGHTPTTATDMLTTILRSSEETVLCSICLEVFSEPVTTPCGHNFCKLCICEAWNTDGPCTCPLCNRSYDTKPELSVNTLLRELVSERKLEKNKSRSIENMITAVQCDVCSEPKLKALKSCLVCLCSFCETHLQPHLTVSRLKRHQLMEPVENLEDRMCPTHQRLLELFCATDEKMVCTVCVPLEHKNHELLSLEEAYECRRSSLLHTQTQTQHMVEQRRKKIQDIQRCLELSDTEIHRERTAGLQAFTALIQSVQRHQELFLEELQEKQRRNHKPAQVLMEQLEQEICELEKSNTEAEQLLHSQDPLHFLQHCPALTPPAALKECSSVRFEPETCERSAARAMKEIHKQLSQQIKKVELMMLQFAVDITLDPDTAHPKLVLSENLKQVHHTDEEKQLPDSPLRFDTGVAQESINRKGKTYACTTNGFWCIVLKNKDEYSARADPSVRLSPERAPQKVGVFVDYDESLVSFYDADSADILYSFTGCCFRKKLFPFFSPNINHNDSNSAPLVITAVDTFSGGK